MRKQKKRFFPVGHTWLSSFDLLKFLRQLNQLQLFSRAGISPEGSLALIPGKSTLSQSRNLWAKKLLLFETAATQRGLLLPQVKLNFLPLF